jgi:hypothetical protein
MATMRLKVKSLDQKGKVGLGFGMNHVKNCTKKCATQYSFHRQHYAPLEIRRKQLKNGVHNWRCTLHTIENVESMWHAKTKDAKDKLKKEKFKVASKLFKTHSKRHQDPPKY